MIVLLCAAAQGAWADTYAYPTKTKPEFHAEYSGTFWGNGHTITYMIRGLDEENQGLFSTIHKDAASCTPSPTL